MKWEWAYVEANDGKLKILRSDAGHEIWQDFEWLDREWSEKTNQYIGPMKKKTTIMAATPSGKHFGPFKSVAQAKREIVKV